MKVLNLMTLVGLSLLSAQTSLAAKNCTDLSQDKWMSIEAFKKMKETEGYKIRKFKKSGSCYEIYGTDSSGKNVEVYFNPVDGSVVKSK